MPTRGVERWLTQQLSRHPRGQPGAAMTGCAPTSSVPFPGTIIGAALAVAGGIDPRTDPWAPARSVWPLLEVVAESLDEPWLDPLRAHLAHSGPDGEARRFASVRHVADLYDRYSVHRPQMLRAWLDGAAGTTRPTSGSPSCGGGCAGASAPRARPSG